MVLKSVRLFYLLLGTVRLFVWMLNMTAGEGAGRLERLLFSVSCSVLFGFIGRRIEIPPLVLSAVLVAGFGCVFCRVVFKTAVITAVLAAAVSNILLAASFTLLFPLVRAFLGAGMSGEAAGLFSMSAAGGIMYGMASVLRRIPRLRGGLPFLRRKGFVNIGFWVGIFLLLCSVLVEGAAVIQKYLCATLVCGVLLVLWCRDELSASYREGTHERRADRTEAELERLRRELDGLRRENYELARTNHAANKLIPSLRRLADHLMEEATFRDPEEERYARESVAYIDAAVSARFSYPMSAGYVKHTGVPAVDSMIAAMTERMAASGVVFCFASAEHIRPMTEAAISPRELAAVVGELLTNAQKAAETAGERRVLLHTGFADGVYALSVCDTGAAFPAEVIRRLGRTRVTTRQDGSGIGMEAVISILRAHGGSLLLDEEIEPPYTKRVTLRFDGRAAMTVRTARPDLLALRRERRDITFEAG